MQSLKVYFGRMHRQFQAGRSSAVIKSTTSRVQILTLPLPKSVLEQVTNPYVLWFCYLKNRVNED